MFEKPSRSRRWCALISAVFSGPCSGHRGQALRGARECPELMKRRAWGGGQVGGVQRGRAMMVALEKNTDTCSCPESSPGGCHPMAWCGNPYRTKLRAMGRVSSLRGCGWKNISLLFKFCSISSVKHGMGAYELQGSLGQHV